MVPGIVPVSCPDGIRTFLPQDSHTKCPPLSPLQNALLLETCDLASELLSALSAAMIAGKSREILWPPLCGRRTDCVGEVLDFVLMPRFPPSKHRLRRILDHCPPIGDFRRRTPTPKGCIPSSRDELVRLYDCCSGRASVNFSPGKTVKQTAAAAVD